MTVWQERKPIRTQDFVRVYREANGHCAICGKWILAEDVVIDHRIPLSRGGADDVSNWQLAHRSCNSSKGNRFPGEIRILLKPTPELVKKGPIDLLFDDDGREPLPTDMTVDDIAKKLDVHPDTVRRWLRTGRLKGMALGGKAGYRVSESDFNAFVDEMMRRTSDPKAGEGV